jgi:hypothetical protein
LQPVGKSKVTKLRAKADMVYPLIRLPKTYAIEIGKTAEIFETQHENKRAQSSFVHSFLRNMTTTTLKARC